MEVAFAPRGILRTVWMKAFFHEVRPETVNIRNVKNQPSPPDTSIAVFKIQNRIPAFWFDHTQPSPLLPIASTGHPSMASLHSASSSGVVGCLNT